ncbi:MAG: S9 family peptidase, partial [Caldilineae bacterium]
MPFQPEDYFRLRFLQEADLSPDGTEVVYAVSWVEEEPAKTQEDKGESKASLKEVKALFLLSLADGAARQLTSGTQQDHSPAWSPDGRQIAFISDRSGSAQVFILPR